MDGYDLPRSHFRLSEEIGAEKKTPQGIALRGNLRLEVITSGLPWRRQPQALPLHPQQRPS